MCVTFSKTKRRSHVMLFNIEEIKDETNSNPNLVQMQRQRWGPLQILELAGISHKGHAHASAMGLPGHKTRVVFSFFLLIYSLSISYMIS